MCQTFWVKLPLVNSGKLKGLAVSAKKRSPTLPELPTIDSFYPGYEVTIWQGLFAPAGTPREIIDKVNTLVNTFLKSDDGRAQLRKLGITPLGGTPEALQAHLDRERAKWGPIIQEANITLQ